MTLTRKGDRVRLDATGDPHTRLTPGATGTVLHVDDAGTVHVRWDDGHDLGMVAEEDDWTVIDAPGEAQPAPDLT